MSPRTKRKIMLALMIDGAALLLVGFMLDKTTALETLAGWLAIAFMSGPVLLILSGMMDNAEGEVR